MLKIIDYPENPSFYVQIVNDGFDEPTFKYKMRDMVNTFKVFDKGVIHTYEYQNKLIDGNVYFVDPQTYTALRGLLPRIKEYLKTKDIPFTDASTKFNKELLNSEQTTTFMKSLFLPHKPFDFQEKMVNISLNLKRVISLAAVGSGKSMVIYTLSRFFSAINKKVLIITPNLMLKNQLYNDFKEYYYQVEEELKTFIERERDPNTEMVLQKKLRQLLQYREKHHCEDFESTFTVIDKDKFDTRTVNIINYQSLISFIDDVSKHRWFEQFDVVIVDEVHKAGSAATYFQLLELLHNCTWRIGFTGTRPSDPVRKLTMDGLFGYTKTIITLRELIDRGLATKIEIQPVILQYPDEDIEKVFPRGGLRKMTWTEESKFVRLHPLRIQFLTSFIIKLANSGKGETSIILIKNRDAQKAVYNEIQNKGHSNVELINGKIPAKRREEIRKKAMEGGNLIIIGGEQILSTGINIPTLTNLIKTQEKAEIELIQSIGRVTRKHGEKRKARVIDIVDDLSSRTGKNMKRNYHYKHYLERKKAYKSYELEILPEKYFDLSRLDPKKRAL